jgi:hypothetical protein
MLRRAARPRRVTQLSGTHLLQRRGEQQVRVAAALPEVQRPLDRVSERQHAAREQHHHYRAAAQGSNPVKVFEHGTLPGWTSPA